MTDHNGTAGDDHRSAAREGGPVFPKRFYKQASVAQADFGFALELDNKPARTPGRNPFVVPTRRLAEAVAAEWSEVAEVVDPRRMPLTRLVNTVIDGVSAMPATVLDEVIRFAESDLVLYRASEPAALVQAQRTAWDEIVDWSRTTLDAPLTTVEGVGFKAQPPRSLDLIGQAIRKVVGGGATAPYRIGALHVMTTLTGSALLALAVAMGRLTVEQAWASAHVDEDFQITQWGEDQEAKDRRETRWRDMKSAAMLMQLVEG